MVNLLQHQPTVSHVTQMRVDGGANCRDFWDKHLLYVLFVRPTSVHVSDGSTFSAAGVGLVPLMLPGFLTFHSLDTAYWTPTERTNTLYPITLKLYSGFCGPPYEALQ